VAWAGKSCDCEWIFRVTESPRWNGSQQTASGEPQLRLPSGLEYFVDPSKVISNYTSCSLNNKHTGLVGCGLAQTWCHVMGQTALPSAHDSLVDCKAQTDVFLDMRFKACLDKTKSVERMEDVFKAKRVREMVTEHEITRGVPEGWKDDTNSSTTWSPPRDQQCTGSGGGGECGPSSTLKTWISNGDVSLPWQAKDPLVRLFLFVWRMPLLKEVAELSNKHAKKDWVRPVQATDVDGNPRARPVLVPCEATDPGARHRHKDGTHWKDITVGYIIAWLAMLLIRSAHAVRRVELFWEGAPHGCPHSFVQNLMPRNNFTLLRHFLHFVDNDKLPRRNESDWHPLQKIQPILREVGKWMALAWTLGKRICIDESMIKHMGRAIAWVQHMPKKPIKHGIKVFALCCAETGVLSSFLICTGKDIDVGQDWSAVGVVDSLLELAGLLALGAGRILYTDNWCTSIDFMKHVFFSCGCLLIGTCVLTKKKSRTADDFPFHRMSSQALQRVPRGWRRRATRLFSGRNSLGQACSFVGQATVWRDKKQVAFLHSHKVEPFSAGDSVLRCSSAAGKRLKLCGVPAQMDYSTSYNGVDRHDRDVGDWGISVMTHRFLFRIHFWIFDASIHLMHNVAIRFKSEWKRKFSEMRATSSL